MGEIEKKRGLLFSKMSEHDAVKKALEDLEESEIGINSETLSETCDTLSHPMDLGTLSDGPLADICKGYYILSDDGIFFRINERVRGPEGECLYNKDLIDGIPVEFDTLKKQRGKYRWARNIKVLKRGKG